MKGPFWSTAFSDAILALVSLHAVTRLWTTSLFGVFSFFLIASAATIGAYRFSQASPSPNIAFYHDYLSWLASVMGMPLMAAAYYRGGQLYIMANAHLASGIAMILVRHFLDNKFRTIATDIVSAAAVISTLLYCSVHNFNSFGIIATLVYAVSGLVIGTNGYLFGVPRVDLFHYGLTIGNIAFMLGLITLPRPVYYNPRP